MGARRDLITGVTKKIEEADQGRLDVVSAVVHAIVLQQYIFVSMPDSNVL